MWRGSRGPAHPAARAAQHGLPPGGVVRDPLVPDASPGDRRARDQDATMRTVEIKGLASVENVDADGRFVAYMPRNGMEPMPIKPGDRLHVRLEGAGGTWIYAIA